MARLVLEGVEIQEIAIVIGFLGPEALYRPETYLTGVRGHI
jgi:hypothetical protein